METAEYRASVASRTDNGRNPCLQGQTEDESAENV
jgi:hypothetical protein